MGRGRGRMSKLIQMINETKQLRKFHSDRFKFGVKGACIEAAACAIREQALLDAKAAIEGK